MQFIYEHIMYAELNTKSDYCESVVMMERFRLKKTKWKAYLGVPELWEP